MALTQGGGGGGKSSTSTRAANALARQPRRRRKRRAPAKAAAAFSFGGHARAANATRRSSPSHTHSSSRSSGRSRGGGGGGRRSSGGGGGGGGVQSRARKIAAQKVREAEQRAREAERARQRQLEEMRKSIKATPIDPEVIAAFAERKRMADRTVSQAQASGKRATSQANTDFRQFARQLGQQTDQSMTGLRQDAASRNLAFQPGFVGVGSRDIRDAASESRTMAEQQRARFLAGIQEQIEQARAAREAEVAAIARDRARAKADHQAFIDAQLAALGS